MRSDIQKQLDHIALAIGIVIGMLIGLTFLILSIKYP